MDVVASWTGGHADALRQALRMTNEAFAEYLGVAVRTVAYWRKRSEIEPQPAMQAILDTALARAPERVRAQFWLLVAERRLVPDRSPGGALLPVAGDPDILTAWLTTTNASDGMIEQLAEATVALAEVHTQVAPGRVLADVLQVHQRTQVLLRSGKQRPRQTRDLLRIEGDLLAHACLLFGDLTDNRSAEKHGNAALLCLQESEAAQATAWYALAKTARWQHHYAKAADLARQGYEHSGGPMRVQLASYEANAAALLGDQGRAGEAMRRAERQQNPFPQAVRHCRPGRSRTSAWRSSDCR